MIIHFPALCKGFFGRIHPNKDGLPGKTGIFHEILLANPPKIRDVFLLLCLA
jgi:hypothetical protein